MDNQNYIAHEPERRRGQHLQREERGTIQHLHRMKWTLRQISRQVNCSASTVLNELRRGTPPRTGSRGRPPDYSAKRGQAVYSANRSHCHQPYKTDRFTAFMGWVVMQVREHHCLYHAVTLIARHHSHASKPTLGQMPEKTKPAFCIILSTLAGTDNLPIPVFIHAQRNQNSYVFNGST